MDGTRQDSLCCRQAVRPPNLNEFYVFVWGTARVAHALNSLCNWEGVGQTLNYGLGFVSVRVSRNSRLKCQRMLLLIDYMELNRNVKFRMQIGR